MEIVNGSKGKRKYRTTDRFFKEEEVELAVEWFKRQVKREAVRIDRKDYYVRVENVMEIAEKVFEDM